MNSITGENTVYFSRKQAKGIVRIVSASYPEAGKMADEIMGHVSRKLHGSISLEALRDFASEYVEGLDFGDLLGLRDELSGRWSVKSSRDIVNVFMALLREANERLLLE